MQHAIAIGSMILIILACGLGLWLPGRYALGPLRARLDNEHRRWQFGLADYFGLLALSQYALAVVGVTWRSHESLGQATAMSLGIAVVALWLLGVHSLSQARISDGRKRFAFLTVVVPAVAVVSVGSMMAVVVVMNVSSGKLSPLSWPVLLVVLAPVAVWCCRKCTEWIVHEGARHGGSGRSSNSAHASTEYEVTR